VRIAPVTSNTKRPQSLLDSAGRFFVPSLGEKAARWIESFPWEDNCSFLAFEGETTVGFASAASLAKGHQLVFLYLDGAANTPANALLLLDGLSGEGEFLLLDPQRLSIPKQEMSPLLVEKGWKAFHRQRHRLTSEDWKLPADSASEVIVLRQVESSDLPTIAFLQATAYHGSDDALIYPPLGHPGLSEQMLGQWLRGRFGKPLNKASVLTELSGEGVGGFILCTEIPKETAFIVTLAVSPRHRGQGLARQLMNRAITTCLEEGYSTIELSVSSDNHAALSLYRSLGFKQTGEELTYRWDKLNTP